METRKEEGGGALGPEGLPSARVERCERHGHEETLDDQRSRLVQLRGCEDELHTLRERECELEVERIAADAALNASAADNRLELDIDVAAGLGEAIRKKRQLETALAGLEGRRAEPGPSSGLEPLRDAREALELWLKAPATARPQRLPRIAHGALLVIALLAVWAAVAIHPALLVVLVGLAIPMAFLSSSTQDLAWLRLGARRRFGDTSVRPPREWEEVAVRERLSEVSALIESLRSDEESAGDRERVEGREEVVAAELVQAGARVEELSRATGVDARSISAETEQWFELASAAHRARERLEEVKTRRERLRAELEKGREQVFRFLSRQGRAPADGHADLDALDAGLTRVAAQPPTVVPTEPSTSDNVKR